MIKKKEDDDDNVELDELDLAQISIDTDFERCREKGLGVVRKIRLSTAFSKKCFCLRELSIQDLPIYLLEDLRADIRLQVSLRTQNIAKARYVALQKGQIIIISDFCQNGSLHDLLTRKVCDVERQNLSIDMSNNNLIMYEEGGQLSNLTKVKIAMKLAQTLKDFHAFTPPLLHGHLHTHNVLFDANWRIKIADFGFLQVKKSMGVRHAYANKSQYSAPEVLLEKGNVTSALTPQADRYSYGMILFELFTQSQPFLDVPLKEIKRIVATEVTRPKIPETVPTEIQTIIRSCWQQQADLRPTFDTILEVLLNIEGNHLD